MLPLNGHKNKPNFNKCCSHTITQVPHHFFILSCNSTFQSLTETTTWIMPNIRFCFCSYFGIYHQRAVTGDYHTQLTIAMGLSAWELLPWYSITTITNNHLQSITIKSPIAAPPHTHWGGRKTKSALPNGEWNSRGFTVQCECAGALSCLNKVTQSHSITLHHYRTYVSMLCSWIH